MPDWKWAHSLSVSLLSFSRHIVTRPSMQSLERHWILIYRQINCISVTRLRTEIAIHIYRHTTDGPEFILLRKLLEGTTKLKMLIDLCSYLQQKKWNQSALSLGVRCCHCSYKGAQMNLSFARGRTAWSQQAGTSSVHTGWHLECYTEDKPHRGSFTVIS